MYIDFDRDFVFFDDYFAGRRGCNILSFVPGIGLGSWIDVPIEGVKDLEKVQRIAVTQEWPMDLARGVANWEILAALTEIVVVTEKGRGFVLGKKPSFLVGGDEWDEIGYLQQDLTRRMRLRGHVMNTVGCRVVREEHFVKEDGDWLI